MYHHCDNVITSSPELPPSLLFLYSSGPQTSLYMVTPSSHYRFVVTVYWTKSYEVKLLKSWYNVYYTDKIKMFLFLDYFDPRRKHVVSYFPGKLLYSNYLVCLTRS